MRITNPNTNQKRWTWLAAGAVAALGLALGSLTARPAAAQPAPAPTPMLPALPDFQIEPVPVLPPRVIRWWGCEDPAAHRIDFAIVSRTSRFEGRVRITGVVKNVGTAAYTSGANQQSVLLYQDGRLVASRRFQNLAVGQEVRVSFERVWNSSSPAEGEFPPTYRLMVVYDPDIYLDSNPDNDDCNTANNSLSRSGSGINALFP